MRWQRTCRLLPGLLAMGLLTAGLLLSGCVVAVVAGAAAGGTLATVFSNDEDIGRSPGPAATLQPDTAAYQDPASDALPVDGTAPVAAVQVQPLE